MNIKKMGLWILCGAMFCTLLTHANAQEAYSSVGPNYGKLYNSTGSSSTPNYGANTNPSDRVAAQQSGLGYSQPATTVNQSTASANVPGYTNTPPSNLTSGFGGASLFPQGKSNITRCAATGSGSTNSDPECNAVNFLANNPGQKITLSSSDPMLKAGADIISNASSVSPTNSRTCNYQNQAVAGTNSTETCNDYYNAYTSTCTVSIDTCPFVPSTITSLSTSGPTNISEVSTGLYNYSISCGWGGGGTCYGSITFNLDAPSQGGYITANSSSLDDTAVIAVNGIVVFYGHPNSGGSWYYPTFGTTAQFVWGYQDTLYQQQCVSYDWESGGCYGYDNVAVATSQYKLSDSCPISGDYSSKTGSQATWCTADGKLVGRIVEGNYYGGISVNGKLPLKAGQNTIQMFGGTEGGPYGGGITLTGQIYNVAPVCSITDNCQAQKALVK